MSGLPVQPYLWIGDRQHDQVASEARISFDPVHNWSGTFGLFYSNTHTRFTIPPTFAGGLDSPATTACAFGGPCVSPAWPNDEIWTQTNPGTEEDKSIFGEAYWKFAPQWTLTLGGRQYWLNQTTDYTAALVCGFYAQVNGNKARVRGAELEASGRLMPGLQFRLGLGYEDTVMTDPGNLALFGVTPGTRVSGVPDFTGSAGLVYTQSLTTDTQGFVSADYSYQGNAISLLVGGGGTEATRPGFSLVNLRFGVDRGDTEVSLNVHNVFNAKPNLGDIGYIGYAQLNAAGGVIPQVATLQPLTVLLQVSKSF